MKHGSGFDCDRRSGFPLITDEFGNGRKSGSFEPELPFRRLLHHEVLVTIPSDGEDDVFFPVLRRFADEEIAVFGEEADDLKQDMSREFGRNVM